MPSAIRDAVTRWRTTLSLRAEWVILVAAILIGVAATLLAPSVGARTDANALQALFIGLLTAVVTITALYAGIARRTRLRTYALLLGGFGVAAGIAGLLRIPLDAYKYAFGIAVGVIAHNMLTAIWLLLT